MPEVPRVVAALLAAGAGSRFRAPAGDGGDGLTAHKLLTPLHGRPVAAHALDHVLASEVGPVVVVTGAVELDLVVAPVAEQVRIVRNGRWAEGQATSLAAAVAVADELGAEHLVVGLADQPFVPAAAWRAVAEAEAEGLIVVASYSGRRGPHPVRLPRSVWPLLPATGDDGARDLLRQRSGQVHEVPCPGSAADIDTWEDVQRWRSSTTSS